METPKEYKNLLSQGILDEQMIADVIYSYNKRAKKFRDKSKEYGKRYRGPWRYDKYGNEDRALEAMENYYGKKDALLQLFPNKAICIHRHTIKKRRRVYDYQKEYEAIEDYVYSNCYYDWEKDDYVYFVDIEEAVDNYYLYYEIGNRSFHSPIKDIKKTLKNERYQSLKIIDLPQDFYTYGEDTTSLLSAQFCNKVYDKFTAQAV